MTTLANALADDAKSVDQAKQVGELAVQQERYLRLAADFDNFKKRTLRDTEQRAAADKQSFILDLLPILDNLDRALDFENAISLESLRQGIEMTKQQMVCLLHQHGIEEVEDVGLPFDPHRHEAISLRQEPQLPDHTVLEVIQRGYSHSDKVFRPAKVIVNDSGHAAGVHCAG
jgi:molecular chaperone GrpE